MHAPKRKDRKTQSFAGRTGTIQIRAREADKRLIDSAAALKGKNRTEFMMESSLYEAQRVLLDQSVFHMSAEAWDRTMAILDAPAKRNARLSELLKKPAPWEV